MEFFWFTTSTKKQRKTSKNTESIVLLCSNQGVVKYGILRLPGSNRNKSLTECRDENSGAGEKVAKNDGCLEQPALCPVLTMAAQSSPLCVQCWRGAKCLLQQRIVRVSHETTLKELFCEEVQPRLPLEWIVAATASSNGGAGTWKDVEVTETVGLVDEFGCRFLDFRLVDVAPAVKRPCPDRPSAFDVLLGAAATASRGGILLHIPCVNMYILCITSV